MKPAFELAEIIKRFGAGYQANQHPNGYIEKTFKALSICRTAALGGHTDGCTDCGQVRISYNSCRNRHCPKCQNTNRERWLILMEEKTLPIAYFHVVFTLPQELNGLCLRYPKLLYNSLFESAWRCIEGFGASSQYNKTGGLRTGMTAVLHTWGQQLMLHPHVHCIVPFGGIDETGKWQKLKGEGKYLFPMDPLKKVFRAKMVAMIRKLEKAGAIQPQGKAFYESLFAKNWVVFAKRPFGGSKAVMEYLGRYTHKVAISNHRLLDITNQGVTFRYKDYKAEGSQREMSLSGEEFLRRFALHILPKGLMKIRHFGLHGNRHKTLLNKVWEELNQDSKPEKENKDWKQISMERLKYNPLECPHCKTETMVELSSWKRGRPPPNYKTRDRPMEITRFETA